MKRLTLYVLISMLTFSAGVGSERFMVTRTPVKSTPAPRVEQFPTVPILLPTTDTFAVAPTLPQTSKPAMFIDYPRKRFDPSGTYVPMELKKKGLAEFAAFWIDAYEPEDKGFISASIREDENYQELEMKFALATERRLIFVTSPTDDSIEYRFEGEFLRGHVIADVPEGKAVLKGTLTKTKKGKKVAEAVVKLSIEVHGC